MITKLDTAYNLARAIRSSDPDHIWTGKDQFAAMLAEQGNEITPTGSVRIGQRFHKIETLWAHTATGEKQEHARL